jgi:callose synthase
MDIPHAPSIQDTMSWNVMTPYYSEDVTYMQNDLEKRTDALGISMMLYLQTLHKLSMMLYLQTLHKLDWVNFLERMNINEDKVWNPKYIDETSHCEWNDVL